MKLKNEAAAVDAMNKMKFNRSMIGMSKKVLAIAEGACSVCAIEGQALYKGYDECAVMSSCWVIYRGKEINVDVEVSDSGRIVKINVHAEKTSIGKELGELIWGKIQHDEKLNDIVFDGVTESFGIYIKQQKITESFGVDVKTKNSDSMKKIYVKTKK